MALPHRRGGTPPEPIIRNLHNIECRDAVLAWDAVQPLLDAAGQPVTRWDGHTTKPHPVTGQEVPDETARVQDCRYLNPGRPNGPRRLSSWGFPPFVGNQTDAGGAGRWICRGRSVDHTRRVSDSADDVMFWWHQAAG